MGHLHAQEYRNLLGKERGLEVHLQTNFYPPLPFAVQRIIAQEFLKYWKSNFKATKLLKNINRELKKNNGEIIGLKNLDHFVEFLNEGDVVY